MSHYDEPVRLSVSFTAPDPTSIVLQGPALEAFYVWLESGSDEDHDEFIDKLADQCEDHIAQWTMIEEWNHDC